MGLETSIESMLHRLEIRNEGDLKQVLTEKSTLEKERKSQYDPIFANIDSIKLRVSQIGELIEYNDDNDFNEQKCIQEQVDEVVAEMAAIKNNRALEYDVLKSQYLQTDQSISGLLQKYDISNNDDGQFVPGRPPNQTPIEPTLQHEGRQQKIEKDDDRKNSILTQISNMEKAIDLEGGQYGSWDEHDHRHFAKLWNSHNNVEDICHRGATEIYGQSYQSVMEHCKWFERYTGYVARKKELIAEWRAIKNAEDKKTIQETEAALSRTSKNVHDESCKRQQQEKEAALRKWKEDKAKQEMEKFFREDEHRAKSEKAERQRLGRRRRILHDKIEKFHDENKLKERLKENNQPKKVEIDERVVQKIHMRNTALINKRKSLVDSKRMEHERNAARTASLAAKYRASIRIQTDPDRLLNPTKAMEIRMLAREAEKSEPKQGSSSFILSAQHRAIPQWRRGV